MSQMSYAFLVISDFNVCPRNTKLAQSHMLIRAGRSQTPFVICQRLGIFSAENKIMDNSQS